MPICGSGSTPRSGRAARGRAVTNLLQLKPDETLTAFLPVREFKDGRYLIFATRRGLVKDLDHRTAIAGGLEYVLPTDQHRGDIVRACDDHPAQARQRFIVALLVDGD